jgi:hypothetical protein
MLTSSKKPLLSQAPLDSHYGGGIANYAFNHFATLADEDFITKPKERSPETRGHKVTVGPKPAKKEYALTKVHVGPKVEEMPNANINLILDNFTKTTKKVKASVTQQQQL